MRRELAEARREVEALRRALAARDGPDNGVGASHVQGDAEPHRAAAAARSSRLVGGGLAHVDQHSSPRENLVLHRTLCAGRTDQRPDGLKEIMVMQCGPIRHRIDRVDVTPR